MYTNADCTIFEKTMGENKMPKWVKHVIKGVYWQSSEGQSQSSTHMNESDTALIIIHALKISYYPKHDDIIVKGLVENNNITEYTIDTTPCDTIVRKYVDGSSIRQFEFVFASRESYGSDIPQNIDNSEFYEQFARWIENNNENLSDLLSLDNYQTAQYIELVTSGYAYDVGDNSARYQIQLRLVYYQDRRYR